MPRQRVIFDDDTTVPCPACEGTGTFTTQDMDGNDVFTPCQYCDGIGRVSPQRALAWEQRRTTQPQRDAGANPRAQ